MAGAEVPVTNPTTGEIRMVPREGVRAFVEQTGWHVSTAEQREVQAENLESGSLGQQALATGEQAVRTATLGLAPGMEGWEQRERVLRRQSPVISGVAQGVGAIAPALATGGAAGALAGAAGLGARGAAAVALAGEGLAGGLAEEVEQARYETRDVSLGNVMLYGLGGELVGRALPHAFALGAGRVKRALTGAEAAAGDGLQDALVATEARAVRSQADLATELPAGSAERRQALRDTAPQQYDRMATEAADDLDAIADLASQMGDTSSSSKVVSRLRETLAEDSPAQMDFFTGVKQRMSKLREDVHRPGGVDAPEAPAAPAAPDVRLRDVNDEAANYDRVLEEQKQKAQSLSPEEAEAVKRYTYDLFKEFNAIQQEKYPQGLLDLTEEQGEQLMAGTLPAGTNGLTQAWIDAVRLQNHLAAGMGKLDVQKPGVLFHGGDDATGDFISKLEPGKTFRTDRTLSTSLKSETGFGFSRQTEKNPFVIRFLDAKAATPVLDDLSATPGAHEMLINPNRDFTVVGKHLEPPAASGLEPRWIIDVIEGKGEPPAWYRDRATKGKPAKAPDLGPSLAEAPGMRGFAKRLESVISTTQRKLDKTTETAEAYLIAREAKKQLQQLSKKMSLVKNPQDALLHDEMRGIIDESWRGINEGLKDRALFGAAADIEAEINGAWSDKVLRGLGVAEGDLARKVDVDFKTGRTIAEYDPKKIRSFLQGDAIDRKLGQSKLEQVLEGAEEMAAAHERHGTWNPDQIGKLRDAVGRVRKHLSLADEIQAAKTAADEVAGSAGKAGKSMAEEAAEKVKGYAVSRAAGAAGAAAGGLIGGPVGAALGWGVGEVAQALGKRLMGIDSAARNATKQTARNLAGVGLGYAQRVAGTVGSGRAGAAIAAGAMTALARFQGDYPNAEASFEAKRKLLDQDALQPEVLYEMLGSSLGDLPAVRPDLFQAIARRTAEKVRFVRENLPPGLQASLLYPNGTPPSRSDLRDFATLWNTVMEPFSVLEDIDAGTATQQQMAILQKSDADLYEQLRGDIIEMVGANFQHVPTSTKVALDVLLGADGLAGPIYSSTAARYIGDAMRAAADLQQRPPSPSSTKASPAAAAPAGINAIQTSVTNRQAA